VSADATTNWRELALRYSTCAAPKLESTVANFHSAKLLNCQFAHQSTAPDSSTMAAALAPSTWRVLGLSVASGYTGLGLFAFCLPHRAAFQYFAIQPRDDDFEDDDNKVTSVTAAVSLLVPLIGARDLSIAAALWTLGYTAKWGEFGTIVVAGSILCAADAIAIWKYRGPRLYVEKCHLRRCQSGLMDFHSGSAVALGALSWVGIGLVLQRQ